MSDAHKFNPLMAESSGNILCFQVDRPISAEGYTENFLPKFRAVVEKYGEARILVYYKHYQGWEVEAADMDLRMGDAVSRYISKVAYINPPQREVFRPQLTKSLWSGELKIFAEDEMDAALAWIRDGAPPA